MSAPRLAGRRCQCAACGDYFNSTSTFDRHRVGYFDSAEHEGSRRCLHPLEMLSRGWSRNEAGFWIERRRKATTTPAEAAREGRPATGVGTQDEAA